MSTKEKDTVESVDTIDQLAVVFDFLRYLTKIWVWILILVIACGAGAFLRANFSYTPVYTASTTFTINIRQEQSIYGNVAYYDSAAAEQMAKTFPYILTSNYLHRTVAADMGRPVRGRINATVTPNTNMLTLSVTDSDPQSAYETLESVIRNYPIVSEPIIGKVTMNVLDKTGIPTEPDNPKRFIKDILIGAEIGLAIGVAWGLMLFITNRTVQSKNDIRKKLGINCLGTVPQINVKKRSVETTQYFLLNDPKMESMLLEPFRLIKNKVEYHCHHHGHKIILVTSATAGEGKSLFAANLALSLVTSGKKVVLIDCDLRHPTGRTVFGMEESTGLGEYLKGESELSEFLNNARNENNHTYPNFFFLPGGEAVNDGSHLLSSKRMEDLLACMSAKSEYVILDSAPAGLLTDSAVLAKYAEAAVMIIRKDFARVDFIVDALGHLSESNIQVIGGVLNEG